MSPFFGCSTAVTRPKRIEKFYLAVCAYVVKVCSYLIEKNVNISQQDEVRVLLLSNTCERAFSTIRKNAKPQRTYQPSRQSVPLKGNWG
jgi:hypothetical protein